MTKRDKRETLKQYQPGVKLADDERNAPHRIRATEEVHAWLRSMSAEQRGELLAKVYAVEVSAGKTEAEKPVQVMIEIKGDATRIRSKKPRAAFAQVQARFGQPKEFQRQDAILPDSPEGRILNLIQQGAWVESQQKGELIRFRLILDGRPVQRVQHGTLKRLVEANRIEVKL